MSRKLGVIIHITIVKVNRVAPEHQRRSLVDLLAGVISIAPSLALAGSGTSALPGVLALAGSEPVLGLVDIAVNHELSGLLILVPVVSVEGLLIWEHLVEVVWVSLSSGDGANKNGNSEFHHFCIISQ